MLFISGILVVASLIFYLAGHGDIRSLSFVCSYTQQMFCNNPQWFLYAAGAFGVGGLLSKLG